MLLELSQVEQLKFKRVVLISDLFINVYKTHDTPYHS